MSRSVIPADPRSPGQVFACLGLMEIAEVLFGDCRGGFDLPQATFTLEAAGEEPPVPAALDFVADAALTEGACPREDDRNARPVGLQHGVLRFEVGHWADETGRNPFKLYSGNRSAFMIAGEMQRLVRTLTKGPRRNDLLRDPWNALVPMAGSFNFDPRGGWTATDTGFSPNRHSQAGGNVLASPTVEIFAAIGLEHARPSEPAKRKVVYSAWERALPLPLARAALAGTFVAVPQHRFGFELSLAGKNKVVTFADQEDSI